jgi:hypothetical protein
MTVADETKSGQLTSSNYQSRDIGNALVTILFVTLSVTDLCDKAWISGAGWACLAVMCLGLAATCYFKLKMDKGVVSYVALVLGVVGIGLILGAPNSHHHHADAPPAAATSTPTPGT